MFRKSHNLKDIELSEAPVEAVLSALSGPVEELRLSHSRELAFPKVYPSPDACSVMSVVVMFHMMPRSTCSVLSVSSSNRVCSC